MVDRTTYTNIATSIHRTIGTSTDPSSTQIADWITDIYIDLYDKSKQTYSVDDSTDSIGVINSTWGAMFVKRIVSRLYWEHRSLEDKDKAKFSAKMNDEETKEFGAHLKRDDDRPMIQEIDIYEDSLDLGGS